MYVPFSISYITRYNVKDSTRHIILGTQHFKPAEFAAQINLSMDNAWGIVRCLIDIIRYLIFALMLFAGTTK